MKFHIALVSIIAAAAGFYIGYNSPNMRTDTVIGQLCIMGSLILLWSIAIYWKARLQRRARLKQPPQEDLEYIEITSWQFPKI